MTVRKFVVALVGMGTLLWGSASAPSAQKMTEQYIPIGQSPGLSGKYTVIGKLQSVNPQERTCTVARGFEPCAAWLLPVLRGSSARAEGR